MNVLWNDENPLSRRFNGRTVDTMFNRRPAGLLSAGPLLVCGTVVAGTPFNAYSAPPADGGSGTAPGRTASGNNQITGSGLIGGPPSLSPGPKDESSRETDQLRPELSIMALLGIGLMPSIGGGVGVGAGFRWWRFAVTMEGRFLAGPALPVTKDRAAYPVIALGIMSGCFHPSSRVAGVLAIEFCPFFGAGRLTLDSKTAGVYFDEVHPFTALAGVRLAPGWEFSSGVYLKPVVELDVPIVVTRMSLDEGRTWQTVPHHASATFGIQISFVPNQPSRWSRSISDLDQI